MRQYIELVQNVLATGTRKPNRTGVDTISTFNENYEIDLQRGFPLLTTKNINWKNIVVEMLWFISGSTDIKLLEKHKCKFWSAWADDNGQVPSAYGNFWRRFPVPGVIDSSDHSIDGTDCIKHNDQLRFVVDELKKNPMSRRMVVSAWAPGNAQTSKLPPCHAMWVVNVQNAKYVTVETGRVSYDPEVEAKKQQRLCLHLTQRSADIALGVPYNIASYALLMHLLSRFSGIPVGTFAHTLIDAHIYTSKADGTMKEFDHVPGLREQIAREVRPLPRLEISDRIQTLEDVEKLIDADTTELMSNFVLHGYEPHPAINFKVAV